VKSYEEGQIMRTVVSKGEYARMRARSSQAVSNWIARGKISAAALIGEGNAAKIWVEQADADLARTLDPAQQAAQEHPVAGALAAPVPAPAAMPAPLLAPTGAPLDDDLARRRRAEADLAELQAEHTRRKMAQDEGRWIEAAAAAKEWGRALTNIIGETETFIGSTLARETAEQFGLDFKTLSVAFRKSYHKHRAAAAQSALDELAALAGEPPPAQPTE
jgi:hypothetical protein